MKYLAYRGMNFAKFEAETYDNTQHKQRNKELKSTQSPHSARWGIEEKNYKDIHNRQSTPSDEWDLDQDVQRNRCTNNLLVLA